MAESIWHVAGIADTVDDQPAGTKATPESLIRIVDAHTSAFPDFPLVAMIAAFDGDRYANMGSAPEVGAHILTTSNAWGPIGWRRDSWGATDSYLDALLVDNDVSYRGTDLGPLIMSRWQTSPIVGEPVGGSTADGGDCDMWDLVHQVGVYHVSSFGNGNYGNDGSEPCLRENVRAGAKASGYRLVIEGGSVSATLSAGASFAITLDWHNIGLTPTYETWQVVYELHDANDGMVWSHASGFEPKGFLPMDGATEIHEVFQVPADLSKGTYDLVAVVRDPHGVRAPLPLAVQGRLPGGGYRLRHVTLGETASDVACP